MQNKAKVQGRFNVTIIRKSGEREQVEFPNGITDAGLNRLLDIMFHGTTQIGTWYIGLINNAGYTTIAAGDTYLSHAGWVELTTYDEATRPAWPEIAAASKSITNTTAVNFTINATCSCRGIFITSTNVKGETTGTALLWSTGLFGGGARALADGDTLAVTYTVTAE